MFVILFLGLGPDYNSVHFTGVHWYVQLWWMGMLFHMGNKSGVEHINTPPFIMRLYPPWIEIYWDSKMQTPDFSNTAYYRVLFAWLQKMTVSCDSLSLIAWWHHGTDTRSTANRYLPPPANYQNSNVEVCYLMNTYHFYATVSFRNFL